MVTGSIAVLRLSKDPRLLHLTMGGSSFRSFVSTKLACHDLNRWSKHQ